MIVDHRIRGGVLGLAAIAGLAGFLLWRRRHAKKHTPSELSRDPRDMPYSPRYSNIPPSQMAHRGNSMGYMPQSELPSQGSQPVVAAT